MRQAPGLSTVKSIVDKLIIGVANNLNKKSIFTNKERQKMIQSDINNFFKTDSHESEIILEPRVFCVYKKWPYFLIR